MTLGSSARPRRAAARFVRSGRPTLGTCAGLIMLDRDHLGLLDVTARRNAFGRQIGSFEADLDFAGEPLHAVFIRAPWVEEHGDGVEVLAEVDGHPVAVRQGNVLAVAFHPELTDERLPPPLALDSRRGGARAEGRAGRGTRADPGASTPPGSGRGDMCVIQSTSAAEALVQAVYEEVLRAGGLPILQLTHGGRRPRSSSWRATSSSTGSRRPRSGRWSTPPCASRSWPTPTLARSPARPGASQSRLSSARKPLLETSMQRSAAGSTAGRSTLFPTHAYAREADMSLAQYEDFFYPPASPRRRPGTAWERQSDESRLADWVEGREEVHIQGRAPTSRSTSRAALDPVLRLAQHARRRVLHRPGRGLGERRGQLLVPGRLRRPRGHRRALPLRGRQGRRRHGRRGEEFLHEMLDTDPGARRLGELGIGTNYGIAAARRRSCSTRRSAARSTSRSA